MGSCCSSEKPLEKLPGETRKLQITLASVPKSSDYQQLVTDQSNYTKQACRARTGTPLSSEKRHPQPGKRKPRRLSTKYAWAELESIPVKSCSPSADQAHLSVQARRAGGEVETVKKCKPHLGRGISAVTLGDCSAVKIFFNLPHHERPYHTGQLSGGFLAAVYLGKLLA